MRCEGNHAPLKGVAANPWLWLLRGDDNGLKMNRFHEELGANPRRSWLNSRNGKIRHVVARLGHAQRRDGTDGYRSLILEEGRLGSMSEGVGGTASPEEITTASSRGD